MCRRLRVIKALHGGSKTLKAIIGSVVLLLAGCERVESISQTAETLRNSTERMASDRQAANDAREARIFAETLEIEQQAAIAQLKETGRTARYEVRRQGGAWAVYDLNTGRAARLGVKSQAGLSQGQAEQAAYEMQTQENEARLRAAAFGAAPRAR